ncbi:MAG: DoxX family protein, partial [Prevotellaceae bacterium]|nr:DoxX family protein [Prevotellaceae bacterium]
KNILTKSSNIQQTVFLIIRLLLAIVFIFSGFVKAIDPLGNSYKIDDYLTAFGGIWEVFKPLSIVFAVALSTFELVAGLSLLFRTHIKITSLLAFLFMCIMTPFSLYIAITNPVSDCGCFGEALVISNQATFIKNIFIFLIALALLIHSRNMRPLFLPFAEWSLVGVFIIISVVISMLCYAYLPLIDFLPYKKGVNIPEAMSIPEDAPRDVYKTTFIYEKDGVQQEFTLENYPKNDSSWIFVDQKSVLVSKGYEPPVTNFSITNELYDDITGDIIHHKGKVYLAIMYDLDKTSEKGAKRAEEVYRRAVLNGDLFYALTGSSRDSVEAFIRRTGVTYPFCESDPTTLKSMIRSNPGLILINNGTIVDKKPWRRIK